MRVTLQILKSFTCDDRSVSFQVELQVQTDFLKRPTLDRVIFDGRGDLCSQPETKPAPNARRRATSFSG